MLRASIPLAGEELPRVLSISAQEENGASAHISSIRIPKCVRARRMGLLVDPKRGAGHFPQLIEEYLAADSYVAGLGDDRSDLAHSRVSDC